MIIVRERVSSVAGAIRRLGSDVVDAAERSDPQFRAVSAMLHGIRDPCLTGILVVGNALISYRLSMPGEEYWAEFSRAATTYFSGSGGSIPEFFEWFLAGSAGNRLGASQKLGRVRRLLASSLVNEICAMCSRLVELRDALASALGSDPSSKTVVFAVKMYYYVCLARGARTSVPWEIDIPVDSRISMLAATSGIVGGGDWRRVWRHLYRSQRSLAARAWRLVAEEAGVPPLRLDALLWLPARAAREAGYRRGEAVRLAHEYLARYTGRRDGGLRVLCEELFHSMQR